jgi:hypothetical protein
VIYADILFSSSLAAVLEIYSQHFYTSSSFNATTAIKFPTIFFVQPTSCHLFGSTWTSRIYGRLVFMLSRVGHSYSQQQSQYEGGLHTCPLL